jgi:predicted dehydrogenase
MNKVRVAVLGAAGAIGVRHIGYLAACRDAETAAIVDTSPKAEELGRKHGVPYYADWRKMLDAVRPDGVIIATPNKLHASMALECIDRGIPSLIEKPIADDIASALQVVDGAEASGVPVLIGHHRRHSHIVRRAIESIQAGDIGKLVSAVAMHIRRKSDAYFQAQWRRERGGGPLLINGAHEIDTLRVLCGEIEELQAATANAARGFAVEDTAAVTLRFRNGALGTLTVTDAVQASWAWELSSGEDVRYAQELTNAFLICGTKGALALPTLELCWNERGGGERDPLVRKRLHAVPADPWFEEVKHFARVIRKEEAPLVTPMDATRTLAGVLAIQQSAETRSWVRIDDLIESHRSVKHPARAASRH